MDRAGEQNEAFTCRRLLPSWLDQAACVTTRECQISGSILGEMAFENGCFHATTAACQGSRRLPLGVERFTSALPALQAWLALLTRA